MLKNIGQKAILFSYFCSSCSWRVRIALNLKNVEYETQAINLRSPNLDEIMQKYSAINPMRQVPALIIDGRTLIDSVVIMHYLEETRTEQALLPQDPYKRAKVREIVEVICAGIQPLQNTGVVKKLEEHKRLAWGQFFIERGFNALEQLLQVSAGKYCVGNDITMADCCLVPQVFNAYSRYQMDLSSYPNIMRINKALESHAAFKSAHPTVQPDFCSEDLNRI